MLKYIYKMGFGLCILFVIVIFCVTNIFAENLSLKGQEATYVPGQILIKFKSEGVNLKNTMGKMLAKSFATNKDMSQIDLVPNTNIALMNINDSTSVEEKIVEIMDDPNVEYAEPNYMYYPQSFNDTYSGNLRGLSRISGYQAFDIFSGNRNTNDTGTIVAVIDVGVAYDHPDLINQMRNGSNCKDENGIFLGSCLYGYDFMDNDKDPYPVRSSHGTHVAGTIAAEGNNSRGILGVNSSAKIMAIRAGDENGMDTIDIIRSINFARQNGAKIINASFGGAGYSSALYDAINDFKSVGGLFVAAAGNDGSNNESRHTYPCDYTLDNILCVTATDISDNLASFSNYGSNSVDIGAPGVNIYSAVANIISSTGLFEDFESTSTGNIPSGWTEGGVGNNWGTYSVGATQGFVLFGDSSYPYANNADTTITKGLSSLDASGLTIGFSTMCDTEYSITSWTDYMALEVSTNGTNWNQIARWDESYLDTNTDPTGSSSAYLTFDLTGIYLKSDFAFRFRWKTNSSDNMYSGCFINNLLVTKYSKATTIPERYQYMQGTSMATPHVAGLASLARSMRPEFNYQTIKSAIIGSGDKLSSLSGKTLGGTRINAYNTLLALGGPTIDRASIYTTIGTSLSGAGIANNLSTITNTNVTSFSGLYFAKYLGSDELGRITFTTGLDLTDTGTQNFLQYDLQNSIGIDQGKTWFTPGTGFAGKNAILKMNFPISFSGFLSHIQISDLLVREGSGGLLIGTDIISTISTGSCVGNSEYACPLYISVDHFTAFELKPKLIHVNLQSNNTHTSYARSGDIVTLSFTGSELLTGINMFINGSNVQAMGTGISWYASKEITTGDIETGISFIINYQDLEGNTGTQISTTDNSFVWVDHTSPFISGENNVTVSNSTATYKITTSEPGSIIYTGGGSCVNITSPTTIVSGLNTMTFTLPNATYSGCQLQVRDNPGNNSLWLMIPTFTVNYTAPSGGGGGGGGGGGSNTIPVCKTSQLVCISSKYEVQRGEDCTSSKIGISCDIPSILLTGAISGQKDTLFNTGINIFGVNMIGSITNSPFSSELNQAYVYAYTIGITTKPTIQTAEMTGGLIRSHMAKMMVNYMSRIMTGKVADSSRTCIFEDIQQESEEIKSYIVLSCKLDIMGVDMKTFDPNQEVTRAQFGTVLSRVLYGETYNGGYPYYKNHLDILKEKGILTNTNPALEEIRGYVMLMLMRSQK